MLRPRLKGTVFVVHLCVFFSTSRWAHRTPLTLRRWWRVARRAPRRAYWAAWWSLIRFCTGSDLAHVCVGHDGAVLVPSVTGRAYWPLYSYITEYPTLRCMYVVPGNFIIDLDDFQSSTRLRVWPTLLKWWTGGRWNTNDCVCVARQVLAAAGVYVPPSCYSPRKLHLWLEAQGYVCTQLRTDDAARSDPERRGSIDQ